MDPGDIALLATIVILILLSMFFSSAETAMTSANRLRMRSLAEEGNRSAERVLKILADPSKMLSMILIGNNIVNLTSSALTTSFAIRMWGNYAVGIATGILTFVVLIFAEVLPKTVASLYADQIALSYSGVLLVLLKLFIPIIFLVNGFSGLVLRLLGIRAEERDDSITEDDLRTFIDVGQEDGVLEQDEHQMIHNVVDFGDSLAKDVMVPRIDMECIDVNADLTELREEFLANKYTRLPVYEESKDHIIGIINLKDLFFAQDSGDVSIRSLMREPIFVYEFKKTSELLSEMRKNSVSIVIVLDEYGVTAGLITLEDLLEEIVGEIRDEYDEDEEELYRQLEPGRYLIDGTMRLEDVNDLLGLNLESEEYDSIAGYVISLSDDLPEEGETFRSGNVLFTVKEIAHHRIETLEVRIDPEKEETEA